MQYQIESKLKAVIPKELKIIIETKKVLKIDIDGQMEEFVLLSPEEMMDAYNEQEDLFDIDIIPFAVLDDDFLCLKYNDNKISIIYWSSERALEEKRLAIFEIFMSYEDFIKQYI